VDKPPSGAVAGVFARTDSQRGVWKAPAGTDAVVKGAQGLRTTTQNDINLGIVNILVGFAPLKPAEFVVIKIQQMAGQVQT